MFELKLDRNTGKVGASKPESTEEEKSNAREGYQAARDRLALTMINDWGNSGAGTAEELLLKLNEENDLPSASQGRVPIATIQAAFDRYKNGGDEKALMEIPRPLRPKLVELLKLEQEGRLETYDSRRQRLSTEAGAKEQVLQESDQTDLKEIRNRINLSLVDFMPNLGDMVLVLRSNGSVCEGKVIDIDGDDIKVSLEGGLTKTIRVDNIRQANERWRETLKRVE